MIEIESYCAHWNYPTDIHVGAGSTAELAKLCLSQGIKAPLLVTDPGLAQLPMVADCVERCRAGGLAYQLFSDIKANPVEANIRSGVEAYCAGQHDGVIALGGGSALDAGKAIALMSGQTRSLWDFEDIGDNWTRVDATAICPVIAIPTTAGTGSEVGRAAVITDPVLRRKRIIFHPELLPDLVILDPELSVGLPPQLTAATGMDALSHNVEALCATGFHPMADGIALQGIALVKEFLPRAYHRGDDITARMNMLVASSMGATAFQKGLGAMHALAHPLGALFDTHHGLLNAILMPYVLQANRPVVEPVLARAACCVGLSECSYQGFLDWVLSLREELGIPHSLAEIAIDDSELQLIASMAVADSAAAGNPIAFDRDGYAGIFRSALKGEL